MKTVYECQICKSIVDGLPEQWCSECGGHRIIFKRITFKDQEFSIAS